jgi:hypothetical protein
MALGGLTGEKTTGANEMRATQEFQSDHEPHPLSGS